MSIENIVQRHATRIKDLDSLFDAYKNLMFRPSFFTDEEAAQIIYKTNDLLMLLSRPFFEYGKFKDTWDDSKFHMNVYGQHLIFESKKTNHTFEFGLDLQHIYLESTLMFPENLKNMDDEFWRMFLDLSDYGIFSFVENSGISSKESQYFNNKKSNLFRLLRNYMLHDIDNVELEPLQRNFDMSLGWLRIQWPFGTPWTEIMANGSMAFKIMYNLNYNLWKVSDTKIKYKQGRNKP